MNSPTAVRPLIESSGTKFLRLLTALIEQTKAGRVEWTVFAYPCYDPYRIGKAECQCGTVAVELQRIDGPYRLFVKGAEGGPFEFASCAHTIDLFRDLGFLVFGGGDRQGLLDTALRGIEAVPA